MAHAATNACIPECPAGAIYTEEEEPANLRAFVAINRERAAEWPAIARRKPPLPELDPWKDAAGKLAGLPPEPTLTELP